MTTTHFTNGVSNQTVGDPLYDYPYLDPFKFYSYVNDFFTYHASEWTITTTEAGTGSATEAGGARLVTNAAGDNDLDFFNLKGESFKFVSTKRMFFKAKFKVNDATQSDVVMGLTITDTTPLDTTDGIFFQKDDGDANIDFYVEKNNAASSKTAIGTLVNDTFITVAFVYEPSGNSGSGSFSIYMDDARVGEETTLTNVPDDEELTIAFGIQNGAAAAKTMTIDYIICAVER